MFNVPFKAICPQEKDNGCKKTKNYNGNVPAVFCEISNNGKERNPLTDVIQILCGAFSLIFSHVWSIPKSTITRQRK